MVSLLCILRRPVEPNPPETIFVTEALPAIPLPSLPPTYDDISGTVTGDKEMNISSGYERLQAPNNIYNSLRNAPTPPPMRPDRPPPVPPPPPPVKPKPKPKPRDPDENDDDENGDYLHFSPVL